MEKQDRSAIAARHPPHQLAQDRHTKAPVITTHHSANPKVETAMRPSWLRFEDDRGLPGFELEVHNQFDPLIADGTIQTGTYALLEQRIPN